MRRSDSNHWVILGVTALCANFVPIVLLLKTATPLAIGVTLVLAAALFLISYLLTCTPRWWVLPLASSPLIVLPLLTGLLFIGALVGIVPVP
jgi:hypothetical protein